MVSVPSVPVMYCKLTEPPLPTRGEGLHRIIVHRLLPAKGVEGVYPQAASDCDCDCVFCSASHHFIHMTTSRVLLSLVVDFARHT